MTTTTTTTIMHTLANNIASGASTAAEVIQKNTNTGFTFCIWTTDDRLDKVTGIKLTDDQIAKVLKMAEEVQAAEEADIDEQVAEHVRRLEQEMSDNIRETDPERN